MEDENWKSISGSDGLYEVSNFGNIKSVNFKRSGNSKILNVYSKTGYSVATISINKKATKKFVHVLVLEAFIGPRPEGYQACHNDGNSLNNRLDNLRWDTREGNQLDRINHGRLPSGENHHKAKVTEKQIMEIYSFRKKGLSYNEISKIFKVSQSAIRLILTGNTWKHLFNNNLHMN